MLYNEKQKQNYFEKICVTNIIKRYFERTEPIETKLDKDLCQWSINEIISFYKSLCSSSMYYILVINTQYKAYVNWCLAENLVEDGMNHFEEVNREMILDCLNNQLLNTQIVTREELLRQLECFENPADQFVCLGIFEGLAGNNMEEILKIRLSNFNTKTKEIEIGEKKIKYSDKLYNLALESIEEQYYYNTDNPKAKRSQMPLVQDSDLIIRKVLTRGTLDDTLSKETLRKRLIGLKERYSLPFCSYIALKESGRINLLNSLVKEGKCKSIKEALHDPYYVNVFGLVGSRPNYIAKYKEYLIEK